MAEPFPRSLTERERELLWWVLPQDRPAYADVRGRLSSMSVISAGRRGEGNFILGPAGHAADTESPLPSVIAFGEFSGDRGRGSVTVRDELAGQHEVEIVDPGKVPGEKRWTYSSWLPGVACPQCGSMPREVRLATRSGSSVTLTMCATDRRIWVHLGTNGMCLPLPVTLFYSELMRRTGVRDPGIALRSDRLFESLSSFSDQDLAIAFVSYNHVRTKVSDADPLVPPAPRRSFFGRWFSSSR